MVEHLLKPRDEHVKRLYRRYHLRTGDLMQERDIEAIRSMAVKLIRRNNLEDVQRGAELIYGEQINDIGSDEFGFIKMFAPRRVVELLEEIRQVLVGPVDGNLCRGR